MKKIGIILCVFFLLMNSCSKPDEPNTKFTYKQTLRTLDIPSNFPKPILPTNNPLTEEKITLGRYFFYDPIISLDSSLSCARCHDQKFAFSDDRMLSINLNGPTKRNSMPLFNLVFSKFFFWDGRKATLEDAVADALEGEQKFNFNTLKKRVDRDTMYQRMVYEAFGTELKEEYVKQSIASFIRTIISSKSAFDRGKQEGNFKKYLGASAIRGAENIFSTELGDCFHCHGDISGNNLFTDNDFHNNGLDSIVGNDVTLFKDHGHGKVTSILSDYGKFRTPSLRNLIFTAPFFHDGRTVDIPGVFKHYNEEVFQSPNLDANMKKVGAHGIQLDQQQTLDLTNFILSLSDSSIVKDPNLSNPFKK